MNELKRVLGVAREIQNLSGDSPSAMIKPSLTKTLSIQMNETKRVLGTARDIQNLGGTPLSAMIRPSLTKTLSQYQLKSRPGPQGSITLSMPGKDGIGLTVVGGRGDTTQYMTDFLKRGARTITELSRTRTGQTVMEGLNHYSRSAQRQLHGEPAMLLAPVQQGAQGIVGTSVVARHIHNGRGQSLVNWDHLDVVEPAWPEQTSHNVLVGHESIHALRRTQGQNFFSNGLIANPAQSRRWEELQTSGLIGTPTPVNENRLRGELRVRPRWNYDGLQLAPSRLGRLRDNALTRAFHAGGNWLSGFLNL